MIGKGLSTIRRFRNMTQSDLAKKINSTQEYISKIEAEIHTPQKDMIKKIADALDVSPILIVWFGVTEKDIANDKVELYRTLKPTIDKLLNSLFNGKIPTLK
tara:strand:+ start:456 stop:761 length:306 start_codon:yes stop_codon:yes gene_type:complete